MNKITEINTYLTTAINNACGDPEFLMKLYGLCHKRTVQNDNFTVRPIEDDSKEIVTLDSSYELIGYHLVSGGSPSESVGFGTLTQIKNSHNARLILASDSVDAIWVIIKALQQGVSDVVFERYSSDTEQILTNDFVVDLKSNNYPENMVAYSIEYTINE